MDHNTKGGAYDVLLSGGACPVIATLDHQVEKPMVCVVYRASAWHVLVFLAMPLQVGNVDVQCFG
jgi:hypothetical protein